MMYIHGSPNVTAALTSAAAAPSCVAALCTSMAPCEYPDMTIAESGHCWSAVWTSWTLQALCQYDDRFFPHQKGQMNKGNGDRKDKRKRKERKLSHLCSSGLIATLHDAPDAGGVIDALDGEVGDPRREGVEERRARHLPHVPRLGCPAREHHHRAPAPAAAAHQIIARRTGASELTRPEVQVDVGDVDAGGGVAGYRERRGRGQREEVWEVVERTHLVDPWNA